VLQHLHSGGVLGVEKVFESVLLVGKGLGEDWSGTAQGWTFLKGLRDKKLIAGRIIDIIFNTKVVHSSGMLVHCETIDDS
jgi:hypothetical protein